jgi:hypothetical protein
MPFFFWRELEVEEFKLYLNFLLVAMAVVELN